MKKLIILFLLTVPFCKASDDNDSSRIRALKRRKCIQTRDLCMERPECTTSAEIVALSEKMHGDALPRKEVAKIMSQLRNEGKIPRQQKEQKARVNMTKALKEEILNFRNQRLDRGLTLHKLAKLYLEQHTQPGKNLPCHRTVLEIMKSNPHQETSTFDKAPITDFKNEEHAAGVLSIESEEETDATDSEKEIEALDISNPNPFIPTALAQSDFFDLQNSENWITEDIWE
jgi:hypothetical protein